MRLRERDVPAHRPAARPRTEARRVPARGPGGGVRGRVARLFDRLFVPRLRVSAAGVLVLRRWVASMAWNRPHVHRRRFSHAVATVVAPLFVFPMILLGGLYANVGAIPRGRAVDQLRPDLTPSTRPARRTGQPDQLRLPGREPVAVARLRRGRRLPPRLRDGKRRARFLLAGAAVLRVEPVSVARRWGSVCAPPSSWPSRSRPAGAACWRSSRKLKRRRTPLLVTHNLHSQQPPQFLFRLHNKIRGHAELCDRGPGQRKGKLPKNSVELRDQRARAESLSVGPLRNARSASVSHDRSMACAANMSRYCVKGEISESDSMIDSK